MDAQDDSLAGLLANDIWAVGESDNGSLNAVEGMVAGHKEPATT